MEHQGQEPKRVRQLRAALVKAIPKFPNNRETTSALASESLSGLLLVYVNWMSRLVAPRPRAISIEPTLTADRRWKEVGSMVHALLDRARRGDDLGPYLSLGTRRHGYTSAKSLDKWQDKDFVLITMGYHHFHLGDVAEHSHAGRTDLVLFAHVTRTSFNAIALFDHSVFHQAASSMPPERVRMWNIFDQRRMRSSGPGVYLATNPIMTSGHSTYHVRLADLYAQTIREFDAQLDDLGDRSKLFSDLEYDAVKGMKLQWHFSFLDLGLYDRSSEVFYVLREGPA